jgi:hypothetical protein
MHLVYTPAQIPNLINLATNFAISDMTFSEADSPSFGVISMR